MTKRMLIDATHAEETRVVVLDGSRLEDFDVETSTKRQLKGNIYLAKVVRVEPSLQAAFVEYGGNRHGFLAFGEIHPDYYQIPIADRQRLIEAEAEEARLEEEEEDRAAEAASGTVLDGEPSAPPTDEAVEPPDVEPPDQVATAEVVAEQPAAQPAGIATEVVSAPFEAAEPVAETDHAPVDPVEAATESDRPAAAPEEHRQPEPAAEVEPPAAAVEVLEAEPPAEDVSDA